MSDVVAVIVVPAAGDPGELLARGRLGARVPLVAKPLSTAHLDAMRLHNITHPHDDPWPEEELVVLGQWHRASRDPLEDCALPVWWDGSLVAEGWDRFARRILLPCVKRDAPPLRRSLEAWDSPPLTHVIHHAARLESRIGRVVLLTRSADGRLVEVL